MYFAVMKKPDQEKWELLFHQEFLFTESTFIFSLKRSGLRRHF
jgi:hypothetical protein